MADEPGQRVVTQDWHTVVVEATHSMYQAATSTRQIFEKGMNLPTTIDYSTNGVGLVTFNFTLAEGAPPQRKWVLRLNLAPGEHVDNVNVDGKELTDLKHIEPVAEVNAEFFPFQGTQSAPAKYAGKVMELSLDGASKQVVMQVMKDPIFV